MQKLEQYPCIRYPIIGQLWTSGVYLQCACVVAHRLVSALRHTRTVNKQQNSTADTTSGTNGSARNRLILAADLSVIRPKKAVMAIYKTQRNERSVD